MYRLNILKKPDNIIIGLSHYKRVFSMVIVVYLLGTIVYTDLTLPTFYNNLNCRQNSNLKTIKLNYRSLSLKYHPDKSNGNDEQNNLIYLQIRNSYDTLKDPLKKQAYGPTSLTIDIFGEHATQCTTCKSFREYLKNEIPNIIAFYSSTLFFASVFDYSSVMRFQQWGRICLIFLLACFEFYLITQMDTVFNQIFPWRTPAHLINLARYLKC
jgi:uncharacterized membrane protein YjfL (UPF0719 family)